ncbi:MAG: CBS domain-containing protein [Nitrososphaerales archaeon]
MSKDKKIQDLLEDIPLISPNTEVSRIIGLMKEKGYYEVFIQEGDKVACVNARELLKVRDLSTKASTLKFYIPALSLKDTVSRAASLMSQYRLRALPIKEERNIIGMVSAFKLCEVVKSTPMSNYLIKSIMTSNPISLDIDDKVSKARSLMLRRKIDHLPITQEGKLVGILTSSLLLSYLLPSQKIGPRERGAEKEVRFDFPVKRIYQPNPNTCDIKDKVGKVIDNFLKEKFTYSIVVFGQEIQGIVTLRDVISLLEEKAIEDIGSYIVGLPSDPFEAEMAKMKFQRIINFFTKIFPNLLEARAVIKSNKMGQGRNRYEVSVNLVTTSNSYTFSSLGYDLSVIFDTLINRVKRIPIKEKSDRKGISYRKVE